MFTKKLQAGIRLVDNLDSLSRDEIDATQQHNLRVTLTAARQSTNVWRRFPGLEAVDTVDDLAALPLLSAADLAAGCPPHSADLLFDPRSPGLVLRSSGTASRPKVLYHSWDFNDRVRHLGARGVRAALETPPNRVANCLFPGDLNGAFLFVQDITRSLPALAFPMGEYTSPADAAAIIEAHGIDTLAASPAYGAELLARGLRRAPAAAAELPLHRRVAGSRAGAHGALGRTERRRSVAGLFDVRDRSSGLPVPPPDGGGASPPRGRRRAGGHRRGRPAGASRHAR